jgi:hypothetical protein
MSNRILCSIVLCLCVAHPAASQTEKIRPEQVQQLLINASTNNPLNFKELSPYLTGIGREVYSWVVKQHFVNGFRIPSQIDVRPQSGSRQEIFEVFDNGTSSDEIHLVFFQEQDRWKFHDVYVEELGGIEIKMFLSRVIRQPDDAAKALKDRYPDRPSKFVTALVNLFPKERYSLIARADQDAIRFMTDSTAWQTNSAALANFQQAVTILGWNESVPVKVFQEAADTRNAFAYNLKQMSQETRDTSREGVKSQTGVHISPNSASGNLSWDEAKDREFIKTVKEAWVTSDKDKEEKFTALHRALFESYRQFLAFSRDH